HTYIFSSSCRLSRQSVNGQIARYAKGSSFSNIYLTAESNSFYETGDFHIETSTNRLMVGDKYASVSTSRSNILAARTATSVTTNNYLFISCTPPVQFGQKLECVVEGTSRTLFFVSSSEEILAYIYLVAPENPLGTTVTALSLIVVEV
ncbi:hypothetical protein EDB82DRAFT_511176, partial [Fusarium venenatum]|uniref:uncharacterized protein n=1 Tax=Fusarium venenatum TaxID=56646 RepID=UPI001DD4A40C